MLNSPRSSSPKKSCNKPPLRGRLLFKSARTKPAFAAAFTASSSTLSFTVSEKATIASPKATICVLNNPRSSSPKKSCNHPPLRGRLLTNSTNINPAFAAAFTASSLILPSTVSENTIMASPNLPNCSPNNPKSFSPKKS